MAIGLKLFDRNLKRVYLTLKHVIHSMTPMIPSRTCHKGNYVVMVALFITYVTLLLIHAVMVVPILIKFSKVRPSLTHRLLLILVG